jgi:predicted dehydrogenase
MHVVVAGAGRWGRIHCEKVRACNWATLNGVIEPNVERAAMVAHTFGVPTYPSIETCSGADFLIIASPWRDVARLVEQASARKLPFLAEKPVAVTSDVMRRLECFRATANIIGCVGYQLRFHPALNHFELGDTLKVVREECSFDSLWTLICDCGVHDIDLALRLTGGVVRLENVSVSDYSVDVWATSRLGVDIHWHWRIGSEVTRSLVSGDSNIDFTKTSEDLLSHQWEGVRQQLEGAQSMVATLDDATSVAGVLDMVRAYASIA